MASKWDDRKADIQRMVAEGMTDAQIGVIYQVTSAAVHLARKRLGIVSRVKGKRKAFREVLAAQCPAPPLVGDTYIDEAGLTVTRYPARYAAGALVQSVTARPRR